MGCRGLRGIREGSLQEKGADKINVFPSAAFKRGEVFLLWPGKEEY